MIDTINDTMNGVMAGLARLDVWVLLALGVYVTLGIWSKALRQATRIGAWLLAWVRAQFPPVPEPGSGAVQPVLKPNGSGSPEPTKIHASPTTEVGLKVEESTPTDPTPSVYEVLAILIHAGTITTTKAYELLGVTRGASERYQRARGALEAARLRLNGTVTYQELDSDRRSTGRYVTKRKPEAR